MQLSTLKFLLLSLFVAVTTIVSAQTTAYKGDGSKQKPYLVTQITGDEALMEQLITNGNKVYVIAPLAGYGADGKSPASEAQEIGYLLALGDTITPKIDETGAGDNASLAPHILVASGAAVTKQLEKLEANKWYAWWGTYTLSEELGDFVFVVEDVLADPTSISATSVKTPASKGVYDLSGRLVQSQFAPALLPKGLYIVDGKKVLLP